MIRFRVSIAAFMAIVAYLGLAFAALKDPGTLLSEACSTIALAAPALASLAAIYGEGDARAFWGGFAIAGGGFLALNILPEHPPRLVTRGLIERCYGGLSYDPGPPGGPAWVAFNGKYHEAQADLASPSTPAGSYGVIFRVGGASGPFTSGNFPTSALRAIGPDEYRQLFHVILAPLLGLLGGIAASAFAGRRSAPAGPAPQASRDK